ncbi:MAG: transcriptional regulator [marine bacterium B5-7]|nr:MAG: transcriptional regulator [marine bacterium B5-7]
MDRFQRLYELIHALSNRRTPIALRYLTESLECSERTVKRAIEDARNLLNTPIEYDRTRKGYLLCADNTQSFELPGLWFNSSELCALLVSDKLLREIQPGVLTPFIAPLRNRIRNLIELGQVGHNTDLELARRVRVLQSAPRNIELEQFRKISSGLITRRKIRIFYHSRTGDETTERVISPQRLIYYRDNWYLDAWCHLRRALRSFSIDRLHVVETMNDPAKDIDDSTLDRYFAGGYGIFAGQAKYQAVLLFSPSASKWVADERWHPDQVSTVLPDGSTKLQIPYSDHRELMRDILKFGSEVEVLAPKQLRLIVVKQLQETLDRYQSYSDIKK